MSRIACPVLVSALSILLAACSAPPPGAEAPGAEPASPTSSSGGVLTFEPGTAEPDEVAPAERATSPARAASIHCLLRYAAFASVQDERGEEATVLVTVVRGDGVTVGDLSLSGTWAAAIGVVPPRRTCPERYALFGDARAAPARREAMLDVLREHLSRSEHAWYRPAFEPPLLAEIGAHGYVRVRPSPVDGRTIDDVDVSSGALSTAVTVRPPGGGTAWIDLRLPPPNERLQGIVDPGLEATAGLAHPVVPVIGLAVVDPISGRRLAARPGTYAFGDHWPPGGPIQVR